MRIVGRKLLEEYVDEHADLRTSGDAWIGEIQAARWKNPAEMKKRYPQTSILSGSRFVFNLRGNRYRVLTQINFEFQVVLISKVGTHQEYDSWKL